jgi:MFS family permease
MVYSIVGQLTDLFGRRYFYIVGSAVGVVGSIICSRATSINMLIGGVSFIHILMFDYQQLTGCQ